MDKPISIVLKESKDRITSTVNSLNLQPAILQLILLDVYNDVRTKADAQLLQEQEMYSLIKQEEENKEDADNQNADTENDWWGYQR